MQYRLKIDLYCLPGTARASAHATNLEANL